MKREMCQSDINPIEEQNSSSSPPICLQRRKKIPHRETEFSWPLNKNEWQLSEMHAVLNSESFQRGKLKKKTLTKARGSRLEQALIRNGVNYVFRDISHAPLSLSNMELKTLLNAHCVYHNYKHTFASNCKW